MLQTRSTGKALAFAVLVVWSIAGSSQDLPGRSELKRADLTTSSSMEVISSIVELQPGMEVPRHSHHGVESGYVLQGAMIQRPGKDPEMLATGSPVLNLRDVVHGGYKVVGTTPLKVFTVHIVDKGKPLYEYAK